MKSAFKRFLVLLVLSLFILTLPAFAAKGGNEGKVVKQQGKVPHKMQEKEKHEEKHVYGQEDEGHQHKSSKMKKGAEGDEVDSDKGKSEEPPGLIKQREKKQEQERKELGKGSETGQQKREEHSRKWWKFWE